MLGEPYKCLGVMDKINNISAPAENRNRSLHPEDGGNNSGKKKIPALAEN
jgi:hypothetical protein